MCIARTDIMFSLYNTDFFRTIRYNMKRNLEVSNLFGPSSLLACYGRVKMFRTVTSGVSDDVCFGFRSVSDCFGCFGPLFRMFPLSATKVCGANKFGS